MGLLSFMGNKWKISPEAAHQMMEDQPDHILLDVRSPEEFAWARIEGAKLVPVDTLSQQAEVALPDKDALILVYCHTGVRSAQAIKILDKMGYTNIFDFGGILEWPYDVVSD